MVCLWRYRRRNKWTSLQAGRHCIWIRSCRRRLNLLS